MVFDPNRLSLFAYKRQSIIATKFFIFPAVIWNASNDNNWSMYNFSPWNFANLWTFCSNCNVTPTLLINFFLIAVHQFRDWMKSPFVWSYYSGKGIRWLLSHSHLGRRRIFNNWFKIRIVMIPPIEDTKFQFLQLED